MWTTGYGYVIAASADEAERLHPQIDPDDVYERVPEHEELTIRDPDDALTLTASDWLKLRGPGLLAEAEPGARRLRGRAWWDGPCTCKVPGRGR